jgi:hypothetical protein
LIVRPFAARRSNERGDVTTQLVVLTPVVLFLVLSVVQLALWLHAANVGHATAARAVAAASMLGGSDGDGVAAASAFASEAGIRLEGAPTVVRAGGMVRAQVTVHLARVLPGVPRTVTRTVAGPVERFVPEVSR